MRTPAWVLPVSPLSSASLGRSPGRSVQVRGAQPSFRNVLINLPVSWIYQSEIFPMNIRALGASVSTASNWVSHGDYLES